MSASGNEAVNRLAESFKQRIYQGVKTLLESKHLYQSVQVEYGDLTDSITGDPRLVKVMIRQFEGLVNGEWLCSNPSRNIPLIHQQKGSESITFDLPDAKLFCDECNRVEAFNVVSAEDFTQRGGFSRGEPATENQTVQAFVASYLCQSCKSVPEVFLIRRQGSKLTLCGRAPIEHVAVPSVIPRSVRQFYSGAVVAHQSGQTLAGLFLLRTLVEQWVRQQTPDSEGRADEVLEKYMQGLPQDFRDRFTSMRDLYSRLSGDIHEARGSSDLFGEAIDAVVEHFEARRLFKL